MKKQLLLLAFILIVLLAISCAAVAIVLQPAFIKGYDLTKTETANIGTSLSGIITPFFTAISSILIFFALIKQIESNKDQRIKSDGDMVFLLLNQLDLELEGYSYESKRDGGAEQLSTGYYAFLKMLKGIQFGANNTEEKFFETVHGNKIILLIKSFKMVEKRIEISNLSTDYNDVLYYKLYNFYQTKLRNSLRFLIENNNFREKTNIKPVVFILAFYDDSNMKVKQYLGEFDPI